MGLREALIRLISDHIMIPALVAKVIAVDLDKMVVDVMPLDDSPEIFNVRLSVAIPGHKSAGVVIVPKEGSSVLVGQLFPSQWYLIQAYEVDNIYLNGDEFGGLAKWPDQKKELEKMSKRIDGIIDAIGNGVPIPQDGGVGLQNTIKLGLELIVDKEDFENLENEVVKHG